MEKVPLQISREDTSDGTVTFNLHLTDAGVRMVVCPYLEGKVLPEFIVAVPKSTFALKFLFNYRDDTLGDLWKIYVLPYRKEYQPSSGWDPNSERLLLDESHYLTDDEVVEND
jgi:hypothetical protein